MSDYVLVPLVPTIEMIDAWRIDQAQGRSLQSSYAKMIAAAPARLQAAEAGAMPSPVPSKAIETARETLRDAYLAFKYPAKYDHKLWAQKCLKAAVGIDDYYRTMKAASPSEAVAAEWEAFLALEAAARNLPRSVPGSGGASTVHTFHIEASRVWANDEALRKLSAIRSRAPAPESQAVAAEREALENIGACLWAITPDRPIAPDMYARTKVARQQVRELRAARSPSTDQGRV